MLDRAEPGWTRTQLFFVFYGAADVFKDELPKAFA